MVPFYIGVVVKFLFMLMILCSSQVFASSELFKGRDVDCYINFKTNVRVTAWSNVTNSIESYTTGVQVYKAFRVEGDLSNGMDNRKAISHETKLGSNPILKTQEEVIAFEALSDLVSHFELGMDISYSLEKKLFSVNSQINTLNFIEAKKLEFHSGVRTAELYLISNKRDLPYSINGENVQMSVACSPR